jgi:hypothetical protein
MEGRMLRRKSRPVDGDGDGEGSGKNDRIKKRANHAVVSALQAHASIILLYCTVLYCSTTVLATTWTSKAAHCRGDK